MALVMDYSLSSPVAMAGPLLPLASSSPSSSSSSSSSFSPLPSSLFSPKSFGRLRLANAGSISSSSSISSSPSSLSSSSVFSNSNRRSHVVFCQKQQAVDGAGTVTEGDWDKLVMQCETPVLVDFWAPWCGPCRMIETIVDELAREYAGKVRFLKINTDDCPNIATRYGIRSIPTVIIFKQGDKKDTVIGAVPKTTLVSAIEKYLDL